PISTVTILPSPTAISVTISPVSASVQVGLSQQFTATVSGSTNTGVTWKVAGVAGGNSSVGTISATGLYTAPSAVPSNPVTVTAQSVAAPTSSADAALTITPAISPARGKWVTGYYADWQVGGYPINRIDFTALTHIVLVHWLTNSNGTLQSSGWDSMASSVTTPAHASGVKVILMLGGSDDLNFASAANPTNRATLVNSILAKL